MRDLKPNYVSHNLKLSSYYLYNVYNLYHKAPYFILYLYKGFKIISNTFFIMHITYSIISINLLFTLISFAHFIQL